MAVRVEVQPSPRAWTTVPRALVVALRPRQWVKNAVVVLCAVASAIYLVNDVIDAPADRRHPVKRRRPIAAGLVPVPLALATAGLLLAAGLGAAALLGPLFALAVLAYLAVQVGYNLGLKREPIVDIMCIAAGFVIRAIAGAVAVGVPVSGWFLLCVGLLAFYLGIEKRKAELRTVEEGAATRAVLRAYSLPLLLRMESVATGGALLSYALWAIDRGRSPWLLATLAFVAFGLFRYQLLTDRGEGEAPERALLRSPHLVIAILLWVVSCVVVLLLTQGPAPAPRLFS